MTGPALPLRPRVTLATVAGLADRAPRAALALAELAWPIPAGPWHPGLSLALDRAVLALEPAS